MSLPCASCMSSSTPAVVASITPCWRSDKEQRETGSRVADGLTSWRGEVNVGRGGRTNCFVTLVTDKLMVTDCKQSGADGCNCSAIAVQLQGCNCKGRLQVSYIGE